MEGVGLRRDEGYHVVGRIPVFGSDHRAFAGAGVPAYGLTIVPGREAEALRRFVLSPGRNVWRNLFHRPPPFDTYHTARRRVRHARAGGVRRRGARARRRSSSGWREPWRAWPCDTLARVSSDGVDRIEAAHESREALRRDVRIIGLVSSAHFLSHFFQLALPPLFPILKSAFGVPYLAFGLVMSVFYTASGIGQTVSGFLVDRFGARRVLLTGLCLLAATIGLCRPHAVLLDAAAAGRARRARQQRVPPRRLLDLQQRRVAAPPWPRVQRARRLGKPGLDGGARRRRGALGAVRLARGPDGGGRSRTCRGALSLHAAERAGGPAS